MLVQRSVGGAVTEAIATHLAAEGVLVEVGGIAVSIVGIEFVLLAAGIVSLIGAIHCTPTAIQRWLMRSYFGKDPSWLNLNGRRGDAYQHGDWESELKGLTTALSPAEEERKNPERAEAPAGAAG